MGLNTNKILTSNLELVKRVIDFFTSQQTNSVLFEDLQSICTEESKNKNKQNAEKLLLEGQLSVFDFLIYYHVKEQINDNDTITVVEMTIKELVESNIIWPLSEVLQFQSQDRRYKCTEGERIKFLYSNDLIMNLVCGWEYIVDKYKDSVFKIEHVKSDGKVSVGTGFYVKWRSGNVIKDLVITNKHVLENAVKIRLLTRNDEIINYSKLITDPRRDLGFIEVVDSLSCPSFLLNFSHDVLSDILTIGYPSVPMTKYAYQIYHKGEINSFVEDYGGNKLFLFSAKTSSGNSGSPVLDRNGLVIGIVTEELFDPDLFAEKGKLPYYAAIVAKEIHMSGKENIFNMKDHMN